ncbi:GGDEF domain-containing protein [Ostreibacterium oceani]|uniref:diguanylate cyclase n=1 Tax=Ostreibacterium oceani TaxID=2654998 RepID=A0A6N7EYL1_9GAMM|nr:GGDEF domain-containing protein [Ostreibacterium oceani]MPV86640.1 diguanylate cyclase [Ostreibacterium oceani]
MTIPFAKLFPALVISIFTLIGIILTAWLAQPVEEVSITRFFAQAISAVVLWVWICLLSVVRGWKKRNYERLFMLGVGLFYFSLVGGFLSELYLFDTYLTVFCRDITQAVGLALMAYGSFHCVSRNLAERAKLERMASHDDLTHILNRRAFMISAQKQFERAKTDHSPYCLVLMDVDDFKRINDQYGHKAGDETLSAFANYLKNSVRQSDIVCRWGGDEFVVLLANANEQVGEEFAKRIQAMLKVYGGDRGCQALTISIGISVYHHDDISVEDALHRADEAMFTVKHDHKNAISVN